MHKANAYTGHWPRTEALPLTDGFQQSISSNLLLLHSVVEKFKSDDACRWPSSDWNTTSIGYMSVIISSLFFLTFTIIYLYFVAKFLRKQILKSTSIISSKAVMELLSLVIYILSYLDFRKTVLSLIFLWMHSIHPFCIYLLSIYDVLCTEQGSENSAVQNKTITVVPRACKFLSLTGINTSFIWKEQ